MKKKIFLSLFLIFESSSRQALATESLRYIIDISKSMAFKRLESAKQAIIGTFRAIPNQLPAALQTLGGDCESKVLVKTGSGKEHRLEIERVVNSLKAKGGTPIIKALREAVFEETGYSKEKAEAFKNKSRHNTEYSEVFGDLAGEMNEKSYRKSKEEYSGSNSAPPWHLTSNIPSLILATDGEESCNGGDICDFAKELIENGVRVKFVVLMIDSPGLDGFRKRLNCAATVLRGSILDTTAELLPQKLLELSAQAAHLKPSELKTVNAVLYKDEVHGEVLPRGTLIDEPTNEGLQATPAEEIRH